MLKARASTGNANGGSPHRKYQHQHDAMGLNDSYAALGCSPNASDSEIKAAYRQLAKEYHPDRVRATGLGEHITHDAEEKLKQINEAYRKLKNARGFA